MRKYLILLLIALLYYITLLSCTVYINPDFPVWEHYGVPDDYAVSEDHGFGQFMYWWWWERGLAICFTMTESGWIQSGSYEFPPILIKEIENGN